MTVFRGSITGTGHLADIVGDSGDVTFNIAFTATGVVAPNGDADLSANLAGQFSVVYSYAGGGTNTYTYPFNINQSLVTNINSFSVPLLPGGFIDGLGVSLSGSADPTGHTITVGASVIVPPLYGFFGSVNFNGQFIAEGGTLGLLPALTHLTAGSGTIPYTINVTRNGDASGPDSAVWSVHGTGDVPAIAANFLGGIFPSGTISFAAGQTLAQITLDIAPQLGLDPGGDFMIHLSDPSLGATLAGAAAAAAATILPGITLLPGQVRIAGVGNDEVTLNFADTVQAAAGLLAAARINAGVLRGLLTPFTVLPGASIPAAAAGALLLHAGGTIDMPLGYSALAADAVAALTVQGGPLDGQIVMTGTGGLAFNAGLGAGSVIAAGGANLISIYPGGGRQFVQTGPGADTIVALHGDDTISPGLGANLILTGAGNQVINSLGDDLIAAGAIGNVTINAGFNAPVVFLGPGNSLFHGGGGQPTVVAGAGAATVDAFSGGQLWLGLGDATIASLGASTIIGGDGQAAVTTTGVGDLLFAGAGSLDFTLGMGSATVLGASGAMTLRGGAGSLIALSYGATTYQGGAGADTIAAFGGSLTVTGGGGSGLYLGGPGGHNKLTGGGGTSILIGGGDGDLLQAGSGTGDYLIAGTGAETLTGAGTAGAHHFQGGAGANLMIGGTGASQFLAGTGSATMVGGSGLNLFAFANGNAGAATLQGFGGLSYLSLIGFPSGTTEAGNALAQATVAGGNTSLALSDGTRITVLGITDLSLTNFLLSN